MRLLLLALLLPLLLAAEDAKLSPAADKAYAAYTAALVKAYQSETDKVRAALRREQDVLTKKGDLDGAMAVKGLLTKIDEGQGLEDAKAALKAPLIDDLKAKVDDVARQVEGVWKVTKPGWSTTLSIQGTGSVVAGDGTSGQWSAADGVFKIQWAGVQDRWESFPLPVPAKKTWTGDSWNLGKKTVSIVKVSE